MKKLFLVLLIFTLALTFVNADLTFDNVADYSEDDMKVTIKNMFGLTTFGDLTLRSHSSVDEVKPVSQGDSVVMWYNVNFKALYEGGLGDIKFINMRTGNPVLRDYKFVQWVEGVCSTNTHKGNGTSYDSCASGTWTDYLSRDIKGENITIGIKVKVNRKDYIDGVWTIAGQEISRHATWTEVDVENYQNTVGGADIFGATITLTANATNGFVKALGIGRGDGSAASVFKVDINQSGSNIATANINIDGIDSTTEYANFTSADYTTSLVPGEFTIDIHRVSGDILFQRGDPITYIGSMFLFSGQIMTVTSTGTTITYGNVTLSGLDVSLLSPVDYFNTTNPTIPLTASAINYATNIQIDNVSLYIDGVINQTNSSLTNGTYLFTPTFADGSYNWTVIATDNESSSTTTTTRFFDVETVIPTINISSPLTSYTLLVNNTAIHLNFTATDSNLDTCSYDFNGTNYTATCNSGVRTNVTLFQEQGRYNVTVYVNDTFGNSNSSTREWSFKFYEVNSSAQQGVIEGETSNYFAFGELGGVLTVSTATLFYNNSPNVGTTFTVGDLEGLQKLNLVAPFVSSTQNVSYLWNILLSDSTSINLTSSVQTVNSIDLGGCATLNETLYNFTILDEDTQLKINTTLHSTVAKINIDLRDGAGETVISTYAGNFTNVNPFFICSNNNLSGGSTLRIFAEVSYESTDYEEEIFHFQNQSITHADFSTVVNLSDLNSSLSQVFEITYRDGSFLPVQDALIDIQRKYIDEDVFKSVEIPKTDAFGKTIGHFIKDNAIYRFVVSKNGEILGTFSGSRVVCQNPTLETCQIALDSFSGGVSFTDFEEENDLSYTMTIDKSTRTASVTFSVPSQKAALFQFNVSKEDALGTFACSDSATAISTTLSCVLPVSIGNSTVMGKLYRDGSEVAKGSLSQSQTPTEIYGVVVVILGLFIMLTLIGAGISDNPIFTVIFFMIGVMLLFALNLVQNNGFIGGSATILYLFIAIILILVKGRSK